MKDMLRYGLIPTAFFTPMLVSAQSIGGDSSLGDFFLGLTGFIQNTLIPLLIAIAFIVFVYGAIRYFLVPSSEEGEGSREDGKQLMFWGIIAFVVIVSVWGIVALIASGLGFGDNENLNVVPDAPESRNVSGGNTP